MAKLFDTYERIVPTWLAAVRHLSQPKAAVRNLLLEIPLPLTMTDGDRDIVRTVDAALRARNDGLTIDTVANTIFPRGLAAKYDRPELYERYHSMIDRAKKPGSWGTYFDRMTRRQSATGISVNPLDNLIEKVRRNIDSGRVYQSTYELPSCDPVVDLCDTELGFELGTYDPTQDALRPRSGPCLSHLSFKITNKTHVDLTAVYRSHTYCSRALGNLIGLARLLHWVADKTELEVGTLSCLSTHAELDVSAWGAGGKVSEGRKVLDSIAPHTRESIV